MPATDAINGYRLFLGREPESERVVNDKAAVPLQKLVANFIASREFSDRVLGPLASGYPLPHFKVTPFPASELLAWASEVLPLAPPASKKLLTAKTWRQLLTWIVSDPDFGAKLAKPLREDLLASVRKRQSALPVGALDREIVGWIDETTMFEVRGWARNILNMEEKLTLEVFLDNLFVGVTETTYFRRDVQERLGGSGNAGFSFNVPAAHHPDLQIERLLTVRDAASHMPIAVPVRIRLGQADTLDSLLRLRWEVDAVVSNMERLKASLPSVLADTEYPISMYNAYQRDMRKQLMARRGAQIAESASWRHTPAITVLLYGAGDTAAITWSMNSLRRQTYRHWECMVCAPLRQEETRALIDTLVSADGRVKAVGSADAAMPWLGLNSMLTRAAGEYVLWLEEGDLLAEDALFEIARALQGNKAAFISFDEDRFIRENGKLRYTAPVLKTAFDRDHLLVRNYIGNAYAASRAALEENGPFDAAFGDACQYDFLLRLTEKLKQEEMLHLERILYHRRDPEAALGSAGAAEGPAAKPELRVSAVNAHLRRRCAPASAEAHADPYGPPLPNAQRVVWRLPDPVPKVSIIIPTRDRADLMGPCLESVFESQRQYPEPYEIIVMDNDSTEPETLELFERVAKEHAVVVIPFRREFNWSAINNLAARRAHGDVLVFLNNDTRVLSPNWVRELASHAMRPEVGAVGARLLYEDGTIQHAGVVLGGRAVHEAVGERPGEGGYLGRTALQRNASAVTGACLATRKDLFLELGGFEETSLKVAFNDVDYCLKVRDAGLSVIYTPFATLYHFESKSRGLDDAFDKRLRSRSELDFMRTRWPHALEHDPFYNARFTRLGRPFSRLRPPQLVSEAAALPEADDELWENE